MDWLLFEVVHFSGIHFIVPEEGLGYLASYSLSTLGKGNLPYTIIKLNIYYLYIPIYVLSENGCWVKCDTHW